MVRLLIVAEHASGASEMLGRARTAAAEVGRTVETVLVVPDGGAVRRWAALAAPEARLVPVPPGLSDEERLDAGLLLRPLPDQVVVVGRDPSSSPAELCLLSLLLELREDLGAITAGDDPFGRDAAVVLERGGAFRPGLLVPAGGFVGDGRRSLHQRLASLGSDSIAAPTEAVSLRELSA